MCNANGKFQTVVQTKCACHQQVGRRMRPHANEPKKLSPHSTNADGSGTAETNASPVTSCSPVMNEALMVAPVAALYSPTVFASSLETNRWLLLSTAKPRGWFSPWMNVASIAAPVVALYFPTMLLLPLSQRNR